MSGTHDMGLEFSGMLPFSVQPVASMPEPGTLLLINQGNEQILRSVMMLEEKSDPDDDDPVLLELKRQDMKINLLLDLLSTILVQFNAIPATRELSLSDSGLSFADEAAEEAASLSGLCEIQLYIEPSVPRPLKLFGSATYDGASKRTVIQFQGMSRTLTDNLDKFIFRFHRRMVATTKAEKQVP